MRDYFSPLEHAVQAAVHPTTIRTLFTKHRTIAYAITAVFLIAITSVFLVIRAAGETMQKNDALTNDLQSTAQTTVTAADDNTQPVAGGNQMSGDTSNGSSNSLTNVTVNNQRIPVPKNGSVTKTVSSNNGNTSVNVSSSSTSNSSSNTSSSTTLNVNTTTDTSGTTSDVKVTNSTQ
jgi:hypothetical protein